MLTQKLKDVNYIGTCRVLIRLIYTAENSAGIMRMMTIQKKYFEMDLMGSSFYPDNVNVCHFLVYSIRRVNYGRFIFFSQVPICLHICYGGFANQHTRFVCLNICICDSSTCISNNNLTIQFSVCCVQTQIQMALFHVDSYLVHVDCVYVPHLMLLNLQ